MIKSSESTSIVEITVGLETSEIHLVRQLQETTAILEADIIRGVLKPLQTFTPDQTHASVTTSGRNENSFYFPNPTEVHMISIT